MPSNKSRVIKDKRRESAEGILLLHLFGSSLPGLLLMYPSSSSDNSLFLALFKISSSHKTSSLFRSQFFSEILFFVLAQFLSQQGEAKNGSEEEDANLSGINDFLLGAKAHQALRYWCCANENTKISLHSFTSFKCCIYLNLKHVICSLNVVLNGVEFSSSSLASFIIRCVKWNAL